MEERLKNVLIINGHQPYPFAKGRLNGTLVALAREHLELGGALTDTRYMLSLTFNAPRDAFENPDAAFFEQRTVDDLLWPMHLNLRFFGMTALPTFSAHDVMKNPEVEADLARYRAHLEATFPALTSDKEVA